MTIRNSVCADGDAGDMHRWHFYLISDLCADDVWAYSDLEQYERDDYLTTLAEMAAGADNRYNLAAANQAQRFLRLATQSERSAFKRALRNGRIYVTPTPNQFLCGSLMLSAYPLVLEPYRQLCTDVNQGENLSTDAYHMEATTWSNGYVNLLACAGFRSFTKSLLLYQAPWIYALREQPRLMRLEVAPGRFIFMLLRCGDYTEGSFVLKGTEETARALHERVIPEHQQWGTLYPTQAIPLVGMYGDLAPHSPTLAEQKVLAVRASQALGIPLTNATFPMFWNAALHDLGVGQAAEATMLRTIRGDTGSSWEVWTLAAQAESARFRKAQRDVVSLRTLDAMQLTPQAREMRDWLRVGVEEVVGLADHAWNGDADKAAVKQLNLAIRRRRLANVEGVVSQMRQRHTRGIRWQAGEQVAVVNTLGWQRACRVRLPSADLALADTIGAETYRADAGNWITVPDVPAFGARQLTLTTADTRESTRQNIDLPDNMRMEPYLMVAGERVSGQGYWHSECGCGEWQLGPFAIRAQLSALPHEAGAITLEMEVTGTPPAEAYELCWIFHLPWRKVIWRGESGGGFTSPGPTEQGGDSMLGIRGSIYTAGEGLSVMSARGRTRLDFALDESGACGLGECTTAWAHGTYGQEVTAEHIARTMPQTRVTDGELYWYLLTNAQNILEALLDQGGTRRWKFRCGLRVVKAPFDDTGLYQFAAGFNHPGELTRATARPAASKPWLQIGPAERVIVLSVSRTTIKGVSVTEVDVYNTARETTQMTFKGSLFAGRKVQRADMLGKRMKHLRAKTAELAALEFARLIVE